MNIIIFLIILLVLVIVHEFGHFFVAKRFGIRVDEFGFGFPPKLFGKKFGETEYTFNLLPLGGFVKIFGETPDEENTNGPEAARSFVNKPAWQQSLVLVAGVVMNFLLAWVLFSIGFMTGLPTSLGSEPSGYKVYDARLTVVSVVPGSPAEKAGLKSGDKIVCLGSPLADYICPTDKSNLTPEDLKSYVVNKGSKPIEIWYERGQAEAVFVTVTPTFDIKNEKPTIGIAMDQIGTVKLHFFRAFYEGMKLNWYMVQSTVSGLFGLIRDAVMGHGSFSAVTGPVGMVGIVGDAYKLGFVYLLSFAGLISINLAVINLLPFPALDGGRLFFLLIEKIKGSRLSPLITNRANMVGFAILIFLMLVITYHDVAKLF